MLGLLKASAGKSIVLPLLVAFAFAAVPVTARAAAPFCGQNEAPSFVFGFATLREQIGLRMGAAVECKHANPDNGDTLQQTTAGLSFYRKSTNTPTFTDGFQHWGLTSDGLVSWTGSSIDPPGVIVPETMPNPASAPAAAATTSPAPTATLNTLEGPFTGTPEDIALRASDLGPDWRMLDH